MSHVKLRLRRDSRHRCDLIIGLVYLQKQPCHLPEETGVQLLCAASYDIWCRDLDTDQTSTEQTCGRTDQNENA